MVDFLVRLLLAFGARFRSWARLQAENVALRQQLRVLNRKARTRVRLRNVDGPILVWMYRPFPSILDAIVIVKPETVLRWHQRSFRVYWRVKPFRGAKHHVI